MNHSWSLLLTACLISSVNAFFGGIGKVSLPKSKVSPEILSEALDIYADKFPKKGARKRLFYESWGIPDRDIDGTPIRNSQTTTETTKSLFDIDEARQKDAFSELSRLYGEENALQMTKILPNILAFNYKDFNDSLLAFSNIFGEEEAKDMVLRNPSLLAVSPSTAATSDDQTMQFSYIVSATRPVGKAGLPLLVGLLSIPGLEQATDIPIRAKFFASLTGMSTYDVADAIQSFSNSLPLMN